jgi:hypothetical protein
MAPARLPLAPSLVPVSRVKTQILGFGTMGVASLLRVSSGSSVYGWAWHGGPMAGGGVAGLVVAVLWSSKIAYF